MTILTLPDALDYMERLLSRFKRSDKASSEDLTMQKYVIDIIQDRIRDKAVLDACENNKK